MLLGGWIGVGGGGGGRKVKSAWCKWTASTNLMCMTKKALGLYTIRNSRGLFETWICLPISANFLYKLKLLSYQYFVAMGITFLWLHHSTDDFLCMRPISQTPPWHAHFYIMGSTFTSQTEFASLRKGCLINLHIVLLLPCHLDD